MPDVATKPEATAETKEVVPAKAQWPEWAGEPFASLRREIDRVFDDFWGGVSVFPFGRRRLDWEPLWRAGSRVPALDLVEKEKEYQVTAELPGLDEKSVEVSIEDDVLTIKGEKKEEKEEKKKDYYLSERRFGAFHRAIRLPRTVDIDKIDAKFQKGVLMITLPKTAEAAAKQKKKIAIKSA